MDLTTIAAKIAQVYEANKKVEAVLLGGSVSRTWHDDFSDIELFIFWKQPPTDVDRMGSIETVNGEVIDFHPFEEEEWSESYITEGIKLEISNFLTATVKQLIHDVVSEYDTDLNKQCIVATISEGVVLTGEESMTALKAKNKPLSS
ncbi:putative nucleotidyltransferase [Alkalihalobacillus xiaoxiensis]|uniref:Nucleotidyltransferase n=1 Tax=Shouchella xiaoxiensis TaxID=766895 RepID=A0ABS2SW99_9BACI|nr:putative nucleotidyltransferase [Shouchella xiaoxiensis]